VASVEREIDKLFAVPLDEFTAARNELAKRLAKDGEKERADEVRALAKPTAPVWAINQLAREDKPRVRALLDAGAKLRKAQEQALRGGQSDALRSAQRAERDAVRDLTNRAGEVLREAGKPATRPTLERISATLGAAAVSDDARDELKAGRLTEELKMSGFDSLAGFVPAPPPRDELAERREKKAERERERRRLEKRARDLERKAVAAETKADEAEAAAAQAREAADEARNAADDAADELAQFEG
jgi:hypothetical protein